MRKQIGLVIRWMFILLILCGVNFQMAYALNVNGVISTDSRWITADSPVNITGDVQVERNITLIIDPGVNVVFQSAPDTSQGYSLRIDGMLIARGDQMEPVVFTAADQRIPWGSIMFTDTSIDWDQDTSSGSVVEYCVIEYGGNEANSSAMISTFNAMPLIARNAIRFGSASGIAALVSEDPAAIFSLSGKIRIISNQIYNNATGILFAAEGGVIEDNYFLNNNRAIDFQVRSNDVTVVNNTVVSSAPELFGTGIRLFVDEAASGIASYQWQQTAGTPVVLSNPQSAVTAFIAADPGSKVETLSFELTVTDKNGLQSADTVEISIPGDNPPPVANAGANSNWQLPQEEGQTVVVTLNGAGSYDPYLGIASYAWRQTEGKAVVLEGANTINPTYTVPANVLAGDRMTFQLTVTDQGGLSSSDTVDIVYFDDNVFPVAAAGEDRTVSQGSTVVLNGTGSSDLDGSIAGYTWVQTDGSPVDLVNPNTAIPYFEAPTNNTSAETFTFRLQVTDNGGLQDVDDVVITVNGTLIAAINASSFAGDLWVLDGSASVDQNATANIDIGSNIIETANENAGLIALSVGDNAVFKLNVTGNNFITPENKGYIVYIYSWSFPPPASIEFPDNWWGTDTATIIQSMIYDRKNNYKLPEVDYKPFEAMDIPDTGSSLVYPPLADAGPDLETAADNSVTLDGSGSYDPDGIARYFWQQIEGPEVTLQNADQTIASFIAPSGGVDGATIQFQLTVSTDDTFSHKDTVNVVLIPDPPIADAGPDLETAADNFVTLDGSGSYAPEGIAKYSWQKIDGPEVKLKNADQAIASFIAPSGGDDGATIQFELTVSTDDTFSSDTVTVTVSPDGSLPTVDVGGCFIQSVTPSHIYGSFFGKRLSMIFLCLIALLGVFHRVRKFLPAVVCILLAALALIATPAHAGYLSVGGGGGGDADEFNVTIETGAKDIDVKNLDMLFGIGIHFIPHSDNDLPSSTISLPCPNDECVRIGSVRKGTEVGFAGKLGVEIGSSDFYISAIGGFTAYTESKLSRSPVTGRVYEESSDSKVEALYGGGVSYFIDYKWDIVLQVDYDNIRGVTGAIGWHW